MLFYFDDKARLLIVNDIVRYCLFLITSNSKKNCNFSIHYTYRLFVRKNY